MKYEVYLITNIENGKVYVGQTKNGYLNRFHSHIKEALSEHYRKVTKLHSAIKHYGADKFKVELLEDNIDESQIDEREKYYISLYNSYNSDSGYNMTIGGQGIHGYTFTDEVKSKISKSSSEFWNNLKNNDGEKYIAFCKSRAEKQKGMIFSEEHRNKLSAIAKKRVGELNSFYGKTHSLESKLKMVSNKNIAVVAFDSKTGDKVYEFKSQTEASNKLVELGLAKGSSGISSRISLVCRKKAICAYGFIWRFKLECGDILRLNDEELAQINHRIKYHHGQKPIDKYDLNGNLIKSYNSVKETIIDSEYKLTKRIVQSHCNSGKPVDGYVYKYSKKCND